MDGAPLSPSHMEDEAADLDGEPLAKSSNSEDGEPMRGATNGTRDQGDEEDIDGAPGLCVGYFRSCNVP